MSHLFRKKPQYIDTEFVLFNEAEDPQLIDKVVDGLHGGQYQYYKCRFLYPAIGPNFWLNVIQKTFQDYLYKHGILLTVNQSKVQLRHCVQQYINSLVGVYDKEALFVEFLTKDISDFPGNFIDYDSLFKQYEYLQVIGIGVAVLRR